MLVHFHSWGSHKVLDWEHDQPVSANGMAFVVLIAATQE
jgi:hypothetical protein